MQGFHIPQCGSATSQFLSIDFSSSSSSISHIQSLEHLYSPATASKPLKTPLDALLALQNQAMPRTKSRPHHDPTISTDTPSQTDDTISSSIPHDNASLNLSVLRRHNPDITSILSIAPYAVIYTFNASSQSWDKSGCEGTLFVCALTPLYSESHDQSQDDATEGIERYAVVVLNRRGLENFSFDLESADSVEVTEEYVLLQGEEEVGEGDETDGPGLERVERRPVVYGVWIFAEPSPSSTSEMRRINARVILECAGLAEASRRRLEARERAGVEQVLRSNGSAQGSVPMGRQISLRDIFGSRGATRSGTSVQSQGPAYAAPASVPPAQAWHTNGVATQATGVPQMSQNQNALLDLFRKAQQSYVSNG